MVDNPSGKSLYHYQYEDSQPDAMVWVCQTSWRPNREISQNEYDRRQQKCQYLKPDVHSEGVARISMVESGYKDCRGYYSKKGNCSYDAVTENDVGVSSEPAETITHA